jgi:hypothetical protein
MKRRGGSDATSTDTDEEVLEVELRAEERLDAMCALQPRMKLVYGATRASLEVLVRTKIWARGTRRKWEEELTCWRWRLDEDLEMFTVRAQRWLRTRIVRISRSTT